MSVEAVPEPVVRRNRCKARSKTTGKRCRQAAIPGGTVCVYHGGRAAQVRRKADLRLAQLVEPAIAQLARELLNTTTGTPMSRLRAIENVLDRAGYPRGAVITNPEQARAILAERIIQLRDLARQREQDDAELADDDDDHEIIEGQADPAD